MASSATLRLGDLALWRPGALRDLVISMSGRNGRRPSAIDPRKEPAMTHQPIDPAATPEDPDAPEIAADDAGASAAAERAAKAAGDDPHEGEDGEGV